jgi:flagellar L-ring protein precursor FlgH
VLPPGTASQYRPSAELSRTSLMALRAPEPRRYSVQDLVTVIIRESTEAQSDSSLETKKDSKLNGEVSAFPDMALINAFAKLSLGSKLSDDPRVGINFKKDFKGDGSYSRTDKYTTRLQARIIDIKPNGTLVLEARKFVRNDGESLNVVLTGTCRKEDVTADNTILSTQLYDLNVNKQATGELRKAAKKGWLSKAFETIFAF